MNWKKILIPMIIPGFGFVVMRTLSNYGEEPPKNTPLPRIKMAKSAIVQLRDTPANLIAYGRLAPAQPVVLYSEVAGELQQGDVPFQPAQPFQNGEVLLEIDDRQTRLGLNQTKSDFFERSSAGTA